MDVGAYYESLILDAVAQADAPLHEALVRSNVYRSINDSYERALAQLVISGKLLYANGEYTMAPEKVEETAEPAGPETVVCDTAEPEVVEVAAEEFEAVEAAIPEAPAPEAFGPMSLRADSTLEQLRVNERSWPTPVAVGVSYDKKPADGLSLMGYELPTESSEVAAEQQELAQVEQQEPAQSGRPELMLTSEPQQLTISFSDSIESVKAVAEPESVAEPEPVAGPAPATVPEQPALALESEPEPANELASAEEPALESEPEPVPTSVPEPSEAAINKLERPECLSGWDDPRCVFDSETQIAFLDKQGVHDVFALVRALGKSEDEALRVAFEKQLWAYALPLSPQYRAQAPELGRLSGNSKLAFDVFGNLRSIGRDYRAYANIKGPITETLSTVYTSGGAPLSLWNLAISPAIQRKLKWNLKIYDLPTLLTYNASALRRSGLTSSEVGSIIDAMNEWPSGRLQLGKTKDEMELARQAAIGGWSPAAGTPLERVEAVNRLVGKTINRLQREGLAVNEPSFRLLFCTRLAGRLATDASEDDAVNSALVSLKSEYPAYNAAVKTFERLEFEPPQDQEDIEVGNTEFTCENTNSADDVIASVDEVIPDGQLDARAEAPEAQASHESERPPVQDLTLEQALKLAIDQDATRFNRWFTDLAYQDRILMGYMLIDDKPARWMDNLGKTAWKIRERYDALMVGRPTFDIDTFGPLFHTYKLTAEEFYGLTCTAQPAFLYMKRVYEQGTIPLKFAEIDKDLEASVRLVVRAYLSSTATEKNDDQVENQVEEKSAPAEQALASVSESKEELESTFASEPVADAEPRLKVESVQEIESEPELELEPTTAPEPESEPESEPELKSESEPVPAAPPESIPVLASEQQAKPFTSKIEDLTGKGPMSIEAWLALLPADDADLLRWVFSDRPLMDYPRKPAGLGPLRRRRDDLISSRPQLDEDQFSSFYTCYDLTVETFCEITQASPMAFGYLKAIKVSNRFSLRRAVNDPKLPQEWRDRIARLYRRPATDTLRTPADIEKDNASQLEQIARKKLGSFSTRCAALRAFAETGAVEDYHTLKDIRIKYQRFLDDNKCGFKQMLVMPSEDTKCINELRGTGSFLVARGNKIRSYKIDNRFTSELRRVLTLAAGRNIECGAGLILRENKELCDLYDVRDDEELYEIIRTYVRPDTVRGLQTVMPPVIRLGETDRKRQMLDVLRDAGTELSREDFAQRYADKYCIDTKTVRSNYLRDMNAYLRNDRYSYVDGDLTAEQQQFIKDMVTEDYVSLSYVTASFAAKFGSASGRLINDRALAPLGLEISRDLIVKKGVDLRKSFENLLMSRDSFAYGSPGFGDEVINHQDFRLAIAQLLRNFTFIECNHGSFISLKHLEESVGIRRMDLSSYAYAVSARMEPGVPFTVASLRKQGFEHKLDDVAGECGFDEAFFDSIVVYGLPQEQIRRTRFGGTYMFCRKEGSFSIADAVEYVAKQRGPIGVDDLIDAFQDDYGVVVTAYDINRAVKDKGLFYNVDLDMVMPNKEANAAYLRRLYIKNNQ